jgi:hypothetical protein
VANADGRLNHCKPLRLRRVLLPVRTVHIPERSIGSEPHKLLRDFLVAIVALLIIIAINVQIKVIGPFVSPSSACRLSEVIQILGKPGILYPVGEVAAEILCQGTGSALNELAGRASKGIAKCLAFRRLEKLRPTPFALLKSLPTQRPNSASLVTSISSAANSISCISLSGIRLVRIHQQTRRSGIPRNVFLVLCEPIEVVHTVFFFGEKLKDRNACARAFRSISFPEFVLLPPL